MKLLVLLIIGIVLFFIARNYKTEKYENIKLNIKEKFEGDLYNHEAGLLIALMAKVSKADGNVCELEAELLKHTFTDISSHFENTEEIREKLKKIYKVEKESFDNTIVICEKLFQVTRSDYGKRLKIMEYLINLAFIDNDFSDAEFMITEDIAKALKIKPADFEKIINAFKTFYANQANNAAITIEDAYKTLGAQQGDDMGTVKKKYRELVRKHHPDIVTGQGANQSIIQEATKKLQELNEAYELIKKNNKS